MTKQLTVMRCALTDLSIPKIKGHSIFKNKLGGIVTENVCNNA